MAEEFFTAEEIADEVWPEGRELFLALHDVIPPDSDHSVCGVLLLLLFGTINRFDDPAERRAMCVNVVEVMAKRATEETH